jgi:hypothetical protein
MRIDTYAQLYHHFVGDTVVHKAGENLWQEDTLKCALLLGALRTIYVFNCFKQRNSFIQMNQPTRYSSFSGLLLVV